LKFIKMKQTF